MHEVLVNRLGGLSLPRKSVVRLTDRPDMTLDVYRGRKTTMQHATSNPKPSQNKPKRPRENDSDTSENEHSQPTSGVVGWCDGAG